jgi:hypothetical protein
VFSGWELKKWSSATSNDRYGNAFPAELRGDRRSMLGGTVKVRSSPFTFSAMGSASIT